MEKIGVKAKAELRNILANCDDPIQAIEKFQADNSILLPSVRASLPLFDLNVVSRRSCHERIIDTLLSRCYTRIADVKDDETKLFDLLAKYFPMVLESDALRRLCFTIIEQLGENTPKDYLHFIGHREELLSTAPIPIAQLVHLHDEARFNAKISRLYRLFAADARTMLTDLTNKEDGLSAAAAASRMKQGDGWGQEVTRAVDCIGKHMLLYERAMRAVDEAGCEHGAAPCDEIALRESFKFQVAAVLHEKHNLQILATSYRLSHALMLSVSDSGHILDKLLVDERKTSLSCVGLVREPITLNLMVESIVSELENCLENRIAPNESIRLHSMLAVLGGGDAPGEICQLLACHAEHRLQGLVQPSWLLDGLQDAIEGESSLAWLILYRYAIQNRCLLELVFSSICSIADELSDHVLQSFSIFCMNEFASVADAHLIPLLLRMAEPVEAGEVKQQGAAPSHIMARLAPHFARVMLAHRQSIDEGVLTALRRISENSNTASQLDIFFGIN